MDRRTFLKMAGMGSVAFAAGCNSHPERNLFSLVQAPDDMVTGQAAWYATTCRECPAGCGVLAKNREGKVIKLEGNPLHPVNHGKLCARGQAAVQGLYNPDRITRPRLRVKNGWEEIPFDKAVNLIRQRLFRASSMGPDRVGLLTEAVGRDLFQLFEMVLAQSRSQGPWIFEPFAFESLKFAHKEVFGQPVLPSYRLDEADLVLGFGADFLETWLSPVEYARKFKKMHAVSGRNKGLFIHVGSFQSLTAANADQWIACRPGTEALVVMALIHKAIQTDHGRALPTNFRAALYRLSEDYRADKVAAAADIPPKTLDRLASQLFKARKPLVLPGPTAANGSAAVAVDLATVLLNALLDPGFALYDFQSRHRVEIVHPRGDVRRFFVENPDRRMDLLLLNQVNPVYNLPAGSSIAQALTTGEAFVAVFANFMDETAAAADLVIPTRMSLESWDAYESKSGWLSTLQPAAGKSVDVPSIGDLFLQLLAPSVRPEGDYKQFLVRRLLQREAVGSEAQWLRMIQAGGHFPETQAATGPPAQPRLSSQVVATLRSYVEAIPATAPQAMRLQVCSSLRFYDGRGANRPWLPELPDTLTQIAWQTVALVAPAAMQAGGWSEGDQVRLESDQGRIDVQVVRHDGQHPAAVVVPLGQGHTGYGRFAAGQGANPMVLLSPVIDERSGTPDYSIELNPSTRSASRRPLARVSGNRTQLDRKIALSIPLQEVGKAGTYKEGLTMHDFPLTLPQAEGYAHHRDIYPPHAHDTYRWGMVVDLDRCVGCGACVTACYAENNIGVTGEQRIIEGREMAWMRIERYLDPQDPTRMIFLPMMCQHCENAPCESVCPVYAPHHSKEGLNNQIYNRCIGTRFCAQNCPYKVRRFNWFDAQWPEPLNLQLNPDVTVRSKGVMEKCSFCVQRIKAAHDQAKNENRLIRDGEIVPACVQTCPTEALFFGNMMDPQSRVRKLIRDARAYQVMGYLNTKPAVIYLKKVTRGI